MVCGVEWCGVVCGVVCGVAWRVVLLAWYGVQLGLWLGVFCDVVWYGLVWCGLVWRGVCGVGEADYRRLRTDLSTWCMHGLPSAKCSEHPKKWIMKSPPDGRCAGRRRFAAGPIERSCTSPAGLRRKGRNHTYRFKGHLLSFQGGGR